MLLPSAVHSNVVMIVAMSGVFVTCTDFPVATSATNTCEASSKFAMYATCVPVGDQTCDEIDAPFGVSIVFVVFVLGSTRISPRCVLVVSDRARFACASTCMPPR